MEKKHDHDYLDSKLTHILNITKQGKNSSGTSSNEEEDIYNRVIAWDSLNNSETESFAMISDFGDQLSRNASFNGSEDEKKEVEIKFNNEIIPKDEEEEEKDDIDDLDDDDDEEEDWEEEIQTAKMVLSFVIPLIGRFLGRKFSFLVWKKFINLYYIPKLQLEYSKSS